jgi:hypothetical protein
MVNVLSSFTVCLRWQIVLIGSYLDGIESFSLVFGSMGQ